MKRNQNKKKKKKMRNNKKYEITNNHSQRHPYIDTQHFQTQDSAKVSKNTKKKTHTHTFKRKTKYL